MRIVGQKHTLGTTKFDILCSCQRRFWHLAGVEVVKCGRCWWQETLVKLQNPGAHLPLYLDQDHRDPGPAEKAEALDEYWREAYEERVAIMGESYPDGCEPFDLIEEQAIDRIEELMMRPFRARRPRGRLVRK